jgi:hypothetical protein
MLAGNIVTLYFALQFLESLVEWFCVRRIECFRLHRVLPFPSFWFYCLR